MIKDIVVNLPVGAKHDVAMDFAISVAGRFEAHLAAVAFAYEPVVPGSVFDGVVENIAQAARNQAATAAQAAIDKFEQAARRQGVSAEPHRISTGLDAAAGLFGRSLGAPTCRLLPSPSPVRPGWTVSSWRRRCSNQGGRS